MYFLCTVIRAHGQQHLEDYLQVWVSFCFMLNLENLGHQSSGGFLLSNNESYEAFGDQTSGSLLRNKAWLG